VGYPTFLWYPDGSGSREDTALGEEVSDLQVAPARTRACGVAVGGRHSSTVLSALIEQIRIVNENMSGNAVAAIVRELWALQAHLARGGACAFTRDPAKSWAGYAVTPPARGDTLLNTTGDVWYYSGSAVLASGDEIVIEGLGPEGKQEYAVVSSVVGGTINLSSGLLYSYNDTVVMVRWRDYWPVLVWPDSAQNSRQPIMTHDRRLNYTLDLALETDPDVAASLFEQGDGARMVGTVGKDGGYTLQELQALTSDWEPVAKAAGQRPWKLDVLE
jgi:hypothetical protein